MKNMYNHLPLIIGSSSVAAIEVVQQIPVDEVGSWLKLLVQLIVGVVSIIEMRKRKKQ